MGDRSAASHRGPGPGVRSKKRVVAAAGGLPSRPRGRIARGLLAGVLGTAALTLSDRVERLVLGGRPIYSHTRIGRLLARQWLIHPARGPRLGAALRWSLRSALGGRVRRAPSVAAAPPPGSGADAERRDLFGGNHHLPAGRSDSPRRTVATSAAGYPPLAHVRVRAGDGIGVLRFPGVTLAAASFRSAARSRLIASEPRSDDRQRLSPTNLR